MWHVVSPKSEAVQVLHEGRLAEMRTGEGKTLVAVLPAYLNALAGKGVQVSAIATVPCPLGL